MTTPTTPSGIPIVTNLRDFLAANPTFTDEQLMEVYQDDIFVKHQVTAIMQKTARHAAQQDTKIKLAELAIADGREKEKAALAMVKEQAKARQADAQLQISKLQEEYAAKIKLAELELQIIQAKTAAKQPQPDKVSDKELASIEKELFSHIVLRQPTKYPDRLKKWSDMVFHAKRMEAVESESQAELLMTRTAYKVSKKYVEDTTKRLTEWTLDNLDTYTRDYIKFVPDLSATLDFIKSVAFGKNWQADQEKYRADKAQKEAEEFARLEALELAITEAVKPLQDELDELAILSAKNHEIRYEYHKQVDALDRQLCGILEPDNVHWSDKRTAAQREADGIKRAPLLEERARLHALELGVDIRTPFLRSSELRAQIAAKRAEMLSAS